MAVVFISPKKRQKMFLIGIGICLVIFLIFISLWVFLAQPTPPPVALVFNEPKVDLNLTVLDATQFQNLQVFEPIPLQFSYTALTKAGKSTSGLVSADSIDDARKMLVTAGLQVGNLKEVGVGRDNPFIGYGAATSSTPGSGTGTTK